jgi:hypothetical protein
MLGFRSILQIGSSENINIGTFDANGARSKIFQTSCTLPAAVDVLNSESFFSGAGVVNCGQCSGSVRLFTDQDPRIRILTLRSMVLPTS